MWTRIPGDDMFADPCMEYASPFLRVKWSFDDARRPLLPRPYDGAWWVQTDKGSQVMDTDNLRLWLTIAGVPTLTDADLAFMWREDPE